MYKLPGHRDLARKGGEDKNMKRASAKADALWTEIICFLGGGIGGDAVGGVGWHLGAQIIGDIHGVEAGGTAGLQTPGLGCKDLAP